MSVCSIRRDKTETYTQIYYFFANESKKFLQYTVNYNNQDNNNTLLFFFLDHQPFAVIFPN